MKHYQKTTLESVNNILYKDHLWVCKRTYYNYTERSFYSVSNNNIKQVSSCGFSPRLSLCILWYLRWQQTKWALWVTKWFWSPEPALASELELQFTLLLSVPGITSTMCTESPKLCFSSDYLLLAATLLLWRMCGQNVLRSELRRWSLSATTSPRRRSAGSPCPGRWSTSSK